MREIYDFLLKLAANNDRRWFNAHKDEYLEAQSRFNLFVEELIGRVSGWDPEIAASALSVKDVTYRIYRDIRFSSNKSPYKTHFGAYICRGGKKSPYAGYYFHIEPPAPAEATSQGSFLGGSLLAVGLYRPDPKVVMSIRDEISVNGDSFLKAIAHTDSFEPDYGSALKRLPRGFEDTAPQWQQLIRLRDFSLSKPIGEEKLFSPSLLEWVNDGFKSCAEFNRLLNMAVDYAAEEM